MFWILQSNLYSEAGYKRLVRDLEKLDIKYMTVKTLYFSDRLVPESEDLNSSKIDADELPEPVIDTSQRIIVMGSHTLAKIAYKRGWQPGAYLNNLSYDIWSKAWKSEWLLNPNAIVTTVGEASFNYEDAFVRPVEDSKSFAGKVFSKEEFLDWQKTIIPMADIDILNKNTEITISKPVVIYNETRNFVVNGKIVTSSLYKIGNKVRYSDQVEPNVLKFAQECIDYWCPNTAFVIDIANTPDGYKIIEVNNFNSAGFYHCDTQKIIEAIESL